MLATNNPRPLGEGLRIRTGVNSCSHFANNCSDTVLVRLEFQIGFELGFAEEGQRHEVNMAINLCSESCAEQYIRTHPNRANITQYRITSIF